MLLTLIKRNCKLFFKDKGMFFSSLITPLILLTLYATFLAKTYKDSFHQSLPPDFTMSDKVINGCVGGQLLASLLAVSCVTVAFCVNLIIIQDKTTGAIRDIKITPVRSSVLSMSYFFSTFISTFIICSVAFAGGMIFIAASDGWFFTISDIALIFIDMIILIAFGTSLSSLICRPLTTQGQASAVGTLISTAYGFISGAYMPISNFSPALQKVISLLPGTYGTSLLKNHALRGSLEAAANEGIPQNEIDGIKAGIDCTPKFFGHTITIPYMYIIIISASALFIGIYVFLSFKASKRNKAV